MYNFVKVLKGLKTPKVNQGVKEAFDEWCRVTTCAGVVDFISATSRFGKIFWLTTITVTLALTIWQTGKLFEDYIFGKPYTTSLTIISNVPIYFPNVTVCNPNRISGIKASNLSKEGLMYTFVAVNQDYLFNYNPFEWYDEIKNYEEDYKEMMRSNSLMDIRDLFHRFGYGCEETFIACQWGGLPFDCCKYASEIINDNGRCWNILYKEPNETGRLQQSKPGGFRGLKLLMNPNVEILSDEIVINSFLSTGIMIYADYRNNLGLPDFYLLSPGTRARAELFADVNKFEFNDINLRELPCVINASLKYSEVEYSSSNCILECYSGEMLRAFGCVYLSPVRAQFKLCSPQHFFQSFEAPNVVSDDASCRKNCLSPCEEETWSLKMSLTTSRFLADPISSNLLNFSSRMFPNANITKQMLQNLIHVNLFFSDLKYTLVVTSERNPLFAVISNIGGQLSLFLGISILTVIQAAYYICSCVYSRKLS